jgi:hypothetical protein
MVDDTPSSRVGSVSSPQSKRASGSRANRPGRLDDRVQADIGRQLRVIYDEIVNEDVPDSLLDLLWQIDGVPPPGDKSK